MFWSSKRSCLMTLFFFNWHILTNVYCKAYQSITKKIIMILKDFFEDLKIYILGIFLKYFPKINHKNNQKVGGYGSCYPAYTLQHGVGEGCYLRV